MRSSSPRSKVTCGARCGGALEVSPLRDSLGSVSPKLMAPPGNKRIDAWMIAPLSVYRKGLPSVPQRRTATKFVPFRDACARNEPGIHETVRKFHNTALIRPRARRGSLRYKNFSGPGRRKLRIPQPPSPPGFEQTGPFVSDG